MVVLEFLEAYDVLPLRVVEPVGLVCINDEHEDRVSRPQGDYRRL